MNLNLNDSQFQSPRFNDDFNNISQPQIPQLNINEDASSIILKNEIQNFENILNLHGFPSFVEFFPLLPIQICFKLIHSINDIIVTRQRDNELKVQYLERISRLEKEKNSMEITISKLRANLNEMCEKTKKVEQHFIEKRAKWKEKEKAMKAEKEVDAKNYQKIIMRETQYVHENKQKEKLIAAQNEKLKRVFNTNDSKNALPLSSPKSEFVISYSLGKIQTGGFSSLSNMQSGKNIKQSFIEDYHKNIETKYLSIIKENEKIKNCLYSFHNSLIELVKIKRDSFFTAYRQVFGRDYPNEGNIDMRVAHYKDKNLIDNCSELSLALDIEPFIGAFNQNMIMLKEFLVQKEELNLISQCDLCQASDNPELSSNSNDIKDQYVQSIFQIFQNYKEIFSVLSSNLKQTFKIKLLKDIQPQEESSALIQNNEDLYMNNIKDSLEENKRMVQKVLSEYHSSLPELDSHGRKLQESEHLKWESKLKQAEALSEELNYYSMVLYNAKSYCEGNS